MALWTFPVTPASISVCSLIDVFSVLSKHLIDFFSEDEAHILKGKKKLYCITGKKITVNTLKNSSSPKLNRQLSKAPQGDHLFYAMLFLIYILYCYALKKKRCQQALCWGLVGDNEVHYKTELGIQTELGRKLGQAHRGKLILGFPSSSERQSTGESG